MIETDVWEALASIAAVAFIIGFIDQIRVILSTRHVDGLSISQWLVFFVAEVIFVFYYAHLNQWLMVAVSVVGVLCCALVSGLIVKYRPVLSR